MHICPECKKINNPGDTVCCRCGVALDDAKADAAFVKICPKCKDAPYSTRQSTCPKCGSPLSIYSQETPEQPIADNRKWLRIAIWVITMLAIIFTGYRSSSYTQGIIWASLLGVCGCFLAALVGKPSRKRPGASPYAVPATVQKTYQWTCEHCGIMNEGTECCDFCGETRAI